MQIIFNLILFVGAWTWTIWFKAKVVQAVRTATELKRQKMAKFVFAQSTVRIKLFHHLHFDPVRFSFTVPHMMVYSIKCSRGQSAELFSVDTGD